MITTQTASEDLTAVELDLSDAEAALLVAMSAATIDRRLAGERAKMTVRDAHIPSLVRC
jgi:hypothetical protein